MCNILVSEMGASSNLVSVMAFFFKSFSLLSRFSSSFQISIVHPQFRNLVPIWIELKKIHADTEIERERGREGEKVSIFRIYNGVQKSTRFSACLARR